jgi:hypothetical protein
MIVLPPYRKIFTKHKQLPDRIVLEDHLNGFDQDCDNAVLAHINACANNSNKIIQIDYHQILESNVSAKYNNLAIKFRLPNQIKQALWESFNNYKNHPTLNYKNFLCSFNGSDHVSRKLLVSIIKKFTYYDPDYCSKNFVFTTDVLDGHIKDYSGEREQFYRKFFISGDSDEFFNTNNSFDYIRFRHDSNIYNLEHKLTQSFLHIVSESIATSYVPFVTEKFLYSVVTRGLFLAYAQPGWHAHVKKYYGFKQYTQLFDYSFDNIQNPIERLVELITMISKFSKLSSNDWHDLYLLERDTIEFNYDHYFGKSYLKCLENYVV